MGQLSNEQLLKLRSDYISGGVVTVNDRSAKEDDQLQDATLVNIFQPIAGG